MISEHACTLPSGTVSSPGGSERLDLWFRVYIVGELHADTSESVWARAVHVESAHTHVYPFDRLLERQRHICSMQAHSQMHAPIIHIF